MSKRELILESASNLFIKKGYKNIRMNDIADYIGITKKTLYNHFPGKFELMKEALEFKLYNILNDLKKISAEQNDLFTVKLKKVIRFAANAFSDEFPLAQITAENTIINNIVFPIISEHIIKITEILLLEGINKGIIRDDLVKGTPPYIFLGIIETFINMERRYGIKTSTDELFIFIEKVLLQGLLSERGREEYKIPGDKL